MSQPLLDVEGLSVHFPSYTGPRGTVRAVNEVSLSLCAGETLGIVGESGCGKSTLARAMLGLVAPTGGRVSFEGQDLAKLSRGALQSLRPRLQMVFQDPYGSLNPRLRVRDAISEPLRVHRVVPRARLGAHVEALLDRVGLDPKLAERYPHEFSGGQRQRVAIARALALEPRVLIADEPVSALDVSVQAQILNLLSELRRSSNLSMVLISHDLAVVRHLADRLVVMYLGRVVEEGMADAVFERPMHPYTRALMDAVPRVVADRGSDRSPLLIKGDPPSPLNPPPGCPFHPRCPVATPECARATPPLVGIEDGHRAACLHPLRSERNAVPGGPIGRAGSSGAL